MTRLDSHHHLWAINDSDYGWMTDEHAVIRRDFLPDDLEPLITEAGISGTVVVQARQTIEETRWLLELAEAHGWIRGVVGWVPLCDNGGEPFLEQFAAHEKLRGLRHVVHDEPDDDFILREDFNKGVARLATLGLAYDILIFWKHLPQTIEFVDRHPDQVFVVDHIAKPRIRKAEFDEEWAAGIKDLARREQVSCKLSGMVTEVRDDSWSCELLQPYFDTVLEAFGPDRLMFGSDWPVCLLRSEYTQWVETVEALVTSLSDHEQHAFWSGNASRVYGLG